MKTRLVCELALLAVLGGYFLFGKPPDQIIADRHALKETRCLLFNMRIILQETYMKDCRLPPPPSLGFKALWEPGGVKGWNGPYMKCEEFTIRDSWQTPLRYSSSGAGFLLTSAGRDKLFDTKDDLTEKSQ